MLEEIVWKVEIYIMLVFGLSSKGLHIHTHHDIEYFHE